MACEVLPDLTGRVYLVLGAGPPTLVDTGSRRPESVGQILAGIEALSAEFGESVRLEDVGRILITHGHIDHVGGLGAIWPKCRAEVAIHELDCRALTAGHERAVLGQRKLKAFLEYTGVEPHRREMLLEAYGFSNEPPKDIPVGRTLVDGEELDGIRVVHTPGHSPGHACFAIGDVLLSGDHVLSRTLSQQWPEAFTPYLGLGHYLDSLDRLEASGEYAMVLPGHEAPIEDLPRRTGEIRQTHWRRNNRLIMALREAESPMTVAELARKMYVQAEGFHAVLALNDVASRIEYLHQRGQIRVTNLDELGREATGTFYYTVNQ